jgi:hypothetical protein
MKKIKTLTSGVFIFFTLLYLAELTSSISNAQLDGIAIEQDRVDLWNEKIANRLARLSQKNRNSMLTSIIITPQAVTMIWNVSK